MKRKAQLRSDRKPKAAERRIYLKHIARLEARNRALSQVLAEERLLRCAAYRWYQKRLSRRWMSFIEWGILMANAKVHRKYFG